MKHNLVTFEDIKSNEAIKIYIKEADNTLQALGYTEHSFPHVMRTATIAGQILEQLDHGEDECRLANIAGYMHDIGNVVNRVDHAHHSALMAFHILNEMGMPPSEISTINAAIGNHDEGTAEPVNAIAAALILADKSDVRRSRVRRKERDDNFDIHDRVNYAVKESSLRLSEDNQIITLKIKLDIEICPVMDYFEIFLARMILCKKAARFLNIWFKLRINNSEIL